MQRNKIKAQLALGLNQYIRPFRMRLGEFLIASLGDPKLAEAVPELTKAYCRTNRIEAHLADMYESITFNRGNGLFPTYIRDSGVQLSYLHKIAEEMLSDLMTAYHRMDRGRLLSSDNRKRDLNWLHENVGQVDYRLKMISMDFRDALPGAKAAELRDHYVPPHIAVDNTEKSHEPPNPD